MRSIYIRQLAANCRAPLQDCAAECPNTQGHFKPYCGSACKRPAQMKRAVIAASRFGWISQHNAHRLLKRAGVADA